MSAKILPIDSPRVSQPDEKLVKVTNSIAEIVDRMCFIHRGDVPQPTNPHAQLTDVQRITTLKRLVIKRLEETL